MFFLPEAFAEDPPAEAAPELPPLVKDPALVGFVQAPYPEEAKAQGLEGVVGLEIEIDASGKVVRVDVIRPAGHGFDEAATEAARAFSFTPAEDATGPVPVVLAFDYGFVLDAAAKEGAVPETPPEQPAAEAPVNLDGVLVEMGTRRPLAEFVVRLEPAGVETTTDAEGRYRFRGVAVGEASLRVVRPGYDALEQKVEVVDGQLTSVRLWLRNQNYNDPGIVGVYRKETADVTRHTITMDEVRRIPGTFGDPVRVVQSLPGAARSPFGTGLLIIRGSDTEDSSVYVDGIRIPYIYHLGGYESVISPDLVRSVDYLPGGFGVPYGRSMGGVVDVTLKDQFPDRIQVRAGADLLDAGAVVLGSLGKENQHGFGIAARRSYIDAFIPLFSGDSGFVVSPRWWDYQARYQFQGKGSAKFSVSVFGFQDDLDASTPEGFSQGTDADAQGDFGTTYGTHRLLIRYENKIAGNWRGSVAAAFGADYADAMFGDSLRVHQDQYLAEIRAEAIFQPSEHFRGALGTDFVGGYSGFDVKFPFNPADFASTDPLAEREDWGFEGTQTGWGPDPYLDLQIRPLKDPEALLLAPGFRWMVYSIPGELTIQAPDPRFSAKWRFLKKSAIKGSIGLYHQPPQPFQSYRADDAAVELVAERSLSATFGAEQEIGQAIRIEVEGFYKDMSDLVVSNPEFTSLDDQYFVNQGVGRVYGVELIARHEPVGRFFGWISYTLMKSERRDHPDEDWYPFDYDQTHNAVLVAGVNLPWDFSISTRGQYTTGNPTTPYDLAVYDVDLDSYNAFSAGATNSDRLPPYWAVNLRIDKLFTFRGWQLDLYVDVINIVHGTNPEFELYNYDYTEKTYITGLPTIPSPGFEIKAEF